MGLFNLHLLTHVFSCFLHFTVQLHNNEHETNPLFLINKTICQMVVHHARSLHKCIDDCRTNKFKPHLFQIIADLIREQCCGRYLLHLIPTISNWSMIHICPYEFIKAPVLFLYFQKCFGICHRGVHFEAVSDDSFI